MKSIREIKFGFSDAENYRRRENKELFNRIFLRTSTLDAIAAPNVFFLVGEKGTGKTAYAVYYSNFQQKNSNAVHKFIRETDYLKFARLKSEKKLNLSDYTDIWKVIIYLLLANTVYEKVETENFFLRFPKIKALRDAINEYYDNAFSPEIPVAFQLVENSKMAAEIFAKHMVTLKAGASKETHSTSRTSRFQTSLLAIQRTFEDCFSSLKLADHFLLFIDGIDVRPTSIPYEEYLDCVKGLANAVWSINNDFFPRIRDSAGRFRVVLLMRPDIFNSLGLQNRNTKLKDNSVVLDWKCVYYSHRNSELFKLADRMFSAQQDMELPVGAAWDHYFPFDATNVRAEEGKYTSFVAFLRYSFHRPRDILTALDILNAFYIQNGSEKNSFEYKDLYSADFRRRYGDYLLGEIRDSLAFYYDEKEFEIFLKFFEFLDGMQKFGYEKFLSAFGNVQDFVKRLSVHTPGFMRNPEEFLQFLYDQNIISYIEDADGERFIRWCFIERTPSNIAPKVKTDSDYEIHYGLANVLNIGKEIKRKGRNVLGNVVGHSRAKTTPSKIGINKEEHQGRNSQRGAPPAPPISGGESVPRLASTVQRGTIRMFDPRKGFGLIDRTDGPPVSFVRSSLRHKFRPARGQSVTFTTPLNRERKQHAANIELVDDSAAPSQKK